VSDPASVAATGPHVEPATVAHQFEDSEQQYQTASLGMWLFLAQEIMFFGGLFTTYAVYRWAYPQAFAQVSRHLDVVMGTLNTMVLIASSLTMVLAVRAARRGTRRTLVTYLLWTMLLGSVFLGIKGLEYHHKWVEGFMPGPGFHYVGGGAEHAQLFFSLYFAMTGLHAAHMIVGVVMLAVLAVMGTRGRFGPSYSTPVEMVGLYWHFVDIIWIFLFPLLYLLGRH